MNFKVHVPPAHIAVSVMSKELREKHNMYLGSVRESSMEKCRHWDPEGWVVSSRDGGWDNGRRKGREMGNYKVYLWNWRIKKSGRNTTFSLRILLE